MLIDPYRLGVPPYVPTPFLLPAVRAGVFDWARDASDTSGTITADASWLSTDYVVVVLVTGDVAVSTPSGLTLISNQQHSSSSSLRMLVYGGFKGATTSWTFSSLTAGAFAMAARAVSNIDTNSPVHSFTSDSVTSASSTRDIKAPDVEVDDDDGLIAFKAVGSNDPDVETGGTISWLPRAPDGFTYAFGTNAGVTRLALIAFYRIAERITKTVAPRIIVSSTVDHALTGTLLLRRAAGTRPTLTPSFTALDSLLASSAVGYAWFATRNGELIASNEAGWARDPTASVNPSLAFTKNVRFPIASISKVITEIAIRRLIASGYLSMTSTIAALLPGFSLGTNVGSITVAQLLQMTSGISASFDVTAAHPSTMTSWLLNTSTNQGEWYMYQNGNFSVLQQMIENVTGTSYTTWVNQNIFSVLGITGALTVPDTTNGVLAYNIAAPTTGADPLTVPATAVGGWNLKPIDIVKLLRELRRPQVLSKASLLEMLRDRYRAISEFSNASSPPTRGEMHWHDGALIDGSNRAVMCFMLRGVDGYDIAVALNTNMSGNTLLNAMRNCLA